jgi:hypothetical protein
MFSRCILCLASSRGSRRAGLALMDEYAERSRAITKAILKSCSSTSIFDISSEDGICEPTYLLVLHEPDCDLAPNSKDAMTKIWTLLKSVLFSVVLVSQSILQDLTYEPTPHPLSVANTIIEIFFNLSFVTSKFAGGLTSAGGGFPQQKRCFYGALDVVSTSPSESAELVLRLSSQLRGKTI